MDGKVLYIKRIAPYKSRKTGENKEGGYELHFQIMDNVKTVDEVGTRVESIWLKNDEIGQKIFEKVVNVIPAKVKLFYETKLFNGRAYPVLADLEVVK